MAPKTPESDFFNEPLRLGFCNLNGRLQFRFADDGRLGIVDFKRSGV
ncbi:MAG: hypothetical protein K8R46_10840 [Pirellulales bacterium]|nr:hypothetical protein [Pirellulales bacterium]